ncbi:MULTISPECIES: UPF0738 family protein [unclassified Cytobacillus]|uniref:UPF0738 family protein n=1 Tax=unclassified Cytobacillus TaxID=2675268 RepID=UPI0013594B7B|nr:hypothetical protein [Cytobacillus sp. AMY 15.2]KAF0816842.1 hypothetical protein KIS4809_4314 [Bacillus sp. ZZV12-4809]MCM3090138.1 hypothetical protein [Cytobacillus sp. AMY 15.2]
MKQKLTVVNAEWIENELILGIETGKVSGLTAMQQILADSDNLSFIYIAEQNDDYTYISLPETVWPELKKALDGQLRVYAADSNHDRIELLGFHEELGDLLENIRGNSNYGNEMVEKAENVFQLNV